MSEKQFTNIQILKSTRDLMKEQMKKGETYNTYILKLVNHDIITRISVL